MGAVDTFTKVYDRVYKMKVVKAASAIGTARAMGIGHSLFTFSVSGDLADIKKYLTDSLKYTPEKILRHYGELGVQRLKEATPIDSGNTAAGWYYTVSRTDGKNGDYVLSFNNHNVRKGANVAYILQMGHGTRQGSYVQGNNYINPALQPIFDDISQGIFKEVANL